MFFLAFPRFSPIMPAESEGCLVVPAVFNTVVGRLPVQGGFDSYPLRHCFLFKYKELYSEKEFVSTSGFATKAGF